jgi:two-component system nitrogen regulation response regulator GlnG
MHHNGGLSGTDSALAMNAVEILEDVTMKMVWVVETDVASVRTIHRVLKQADIQVRIFRDAGSALTAMQKELPQAVVTDWHTQGPRNTSFLREVHALGPKLPIIALTNPSSLVAMRAELQEITTDYLVKPLDHLQILHIVQRAIGEASTGQSRAPKLSDRLGTSPALDEVYRAIENLALSRRDVLITGEMGAGKEWVAHALHQNSPVTNEPYVSMHLSSTPPEHLEAELMGYEKGAVPGSGQEQSGLIEQAEGGTLVLHGIDRLPLSMQKTLLRFVISRHFYRIGGHSKRVGDVRLMATIQEPYETLVASGRILPELLHRLSSTRIDLPPLREHPDDIIPLAKIFLDQSCHELGIATRALGPAAAKRLSQWAWPGNIRQLEGVCRSLAVLSPTRRIELAGLPEEIKQSTEEIKVNPLVFHDALWINPLIAQIKAHLLNGEEAIMNYFLPLFEQAMIETVLNATFWKRMTTAQKIGWGRNTLTRKIQELDIFTPPE